MESLNTWKHLHNSKSSFAAYRIAPYMPQSTHSIEELTCYHEDIPYIHLKDIPGDEVTAFCSWIADRIMPVIPGIEPGDAVYAWDYEEWREHQFWYRLSAMDA